MKRNLLREIDEHFSRNFEEYTSYAQLNLEDTRVRSFKMKKVLEVGCGARFTFVSAQYKYAIDTNIRLLKELKRRNPDINLIKADVRYLPFKHSSFDIVVAVFLLHHLVGETTTISQSNIVTGLCEMAHLLNREGKILVLEHIARNRLVSHLFFYITWIFAKLGIDIKYFDIHDKVVTYFMDEKSFEGIITNLDLNSQVLSSKHWQFRKILLGKDNLFLITS